MAGSDDEQDYNGGPSPLAPLVAPKNPPKRMANVSFSYEEVETLKVYEAPTKTYGGKKETKNRTWRLSGRLTVPMTDEQGFDSKIAHATIGGKEVEVKQPTYVAANCKVDGAKGAWTASISGDYEFWATDYDKKWERIHASTSQGNATNQPNRTDAKNEVSAYVRSEDLEGGLEFSAKQHVTEQEKLTSQNGTKTFTHEWLVSFRFPSPKEKGWERSVTRAGDTLTAKATRTQSRPETGGGWTLTEKIEMTITIDPAGQYEFVFNAPGDYKTWLPRGGNTEDQRGNRMQFTGNLRCTGGVPNYDVKFPLEVRLSSSAQKGVCMNFPANGKISADLKIAKEGTSPDLDVSHTLGTEQGNSVAMGAFKLGEVVTITVDCYDYGASGLLEFKSKVPVVIEGFADRDKLDIPFDEDHNGIADCWQKQYGIAGASAKADRDDKPAGNGPGDGLSLYEEYRGFRCKGEHFRTDPGKKDLFIYDRDGLGYGLFEKSGIVPHLVDKDEFAIETGCPNKRVINCNRGYATLGPQHLLELNEKAMPDAYGKTWCQGAPWIPKNITIIDIDAAACRADSPEHLDETLGHELGYACRLEHHGEKDYRACDLQMYCADKTWQLCEGGAGVTGFTVAAPHGQHSGQQECLMRYNSALLFEKAGGVYAWRKSLADVVFTQGELYPSGNHLRTGFCASRKGTGMNAPKNPGGSVAGDADIGNCASQFQVNDNPGAQ